MFKIQTLNKIAAVGLEAFPRESYEIASEIVSPDAILVRSADMHKMELPVSLKAIARAGAGVNNIPIETCTQKGIMVFNTPGANANGVKELVLAGMLLSARHIMKGLQWAKTLVGKGDEVPKLIEKGKSNFVGTELKGKKLGVIGLGAIGVMVANDAVSLGMQVTGYDPFISVEAAWGLSRNVKRAIGLESLLAESDYVSLHVPLNDKTKGLLSGNRFSIMKKGAVILNFARGGLVNNADLAGAVKEGIVSCYVTDFPDETLLKMDEVISIPHLGASTDEAEDNCACMAVQQIQGFLENGNLKNCVNFPDCDMGYADGTRLMIANENVPNMVGQITAVLAHQKLNISDMINKHKGNFAYNIIDVEGEVKDSLVADIKKIKGIIMARLLKR